jgi:2-amino-4-hydroxy-6-hydroxymethyldihydropteridine diphosphokinase
MPQVWLSIGSNLQREKHVRGAVRALRDAFGELTLSRVYESEAVGFDGDPFFNLVAGFKTELPVTEVVEQLHAIEAAHGRQRGEKKFASRTLDIDLLLYGDLVLQQGGLELPRDEITRYSFVLLPLSEVAGEERHPVSGKTFRELWQAFDREEQPLWPADFSL